MAASNAQLELIKAIDELCAPIEFALKNTSNAKVFFKSLGWDFSRIDSFPFNDLLDAVDDIYTLVLEVRAIIQDPPESLDDLTECLDVLLALFNAIDSISNFINGLSGASLTPALKSEFGKLGTDIVNYLVCGYLEAHHFKIYATLSVLGIITPYQVAGLSPAVYQGNEGWVRLPYKKSTIHLKNVVSLLSRPLSYFKEQFYPASGLLNTAAEAQEFSDKFFPRLVLLFQSLGFDAVYGIDKNDSSLYTPEAFSVMKRTLTVSRQATAALRYGATLSVSPTAEGGHGLVVSLFGDWSYSKQIADWLLFIKASGSIDVFAINASGIHFPASSANVAFSILVQLTRFSNDNSLLGSTTGTRFNIQNIAIAAIVDYSSNKVSYGFESYFNGIEFAIGGEGDNFINKVIPNGAKGKFDLAFGWNSIGGFHFNTGGGLEFLFPLHIKVGPVDFEGVTLGVYLVNEAISIRGGGDISLNLGPIVASIKNIGIKADITFPANNANLGFCNLKLGFKPPTGVGLAIDAGPVKGGGFLNYDEATWTYTGGLELNFSKISFSAIGIVSTKLPGGEKGYSLLIIITAEFGPLPLGMGFTLNGLGGILGLNRTMNPDVLRTGIRDNTLDNILFPKDIVKNANTIISNIGQAFPIKKDQFLVGPMAKIGWGTPTLLTIELGIIIELPEPVRLAILGVVKALLPSKENAIVKIQVNFLGIIDFTNKYLSFDASLYDSQILTFGLFGDMALRLYWGDKPAFLLSVGGFHPRFTPPPLNLPELRRLTLVLANQDNLKISVETYFAVT
ncbi:DUF6603 domain-containing protein, partial [Taibaiella koreensis]|uniref:DUF6603 domain-containing protein n=1 Tax=Taibaiella koreensis TaxID=1268548 RepID=UPI001968FCA6